MNNLVRGRVKEKNAVIRDKFRCKCNYHDCLICINGMLVMRLLWIWGLRLFDNIETMLTVSVGCLCSWGSFKCYIWKCDRVDNINACDE